MLCVTLHCPAGLAWARAGLAWARAGLAYTLRLPPDR
jgi:hypothetical protein